MICSYSEDLILGSERGGWKRQRPLPVDDISGDQRDTHRENRRDIVLHDLLRKKRKSPDSAVQGGGGEHGEQDGEHHQENTRPNHVISFQFPKLGFHQNHHLNLPLSFYTTGQSAGQIKRTLRLKESMPEELPRQYTSADVAKFSRWYLGDYPVYVQEHTQGLLVVVVLLIWKNIRHVEMEIFSKPQIGYKTVLTFLYFQSQFIILKKTFYCFQIYLT